jgi:membrane-associated protease RseP (regulator of RpoE activity)
MRRLLFLAAAWVAMGNAAAPAQSPLDELERRLESGRTTPREPGVLGLTADESGGNGLRVVAVKPGGPAEAAGVRVDDVLLELERKPLRTLDDLTGILKFRAAGESVGLTLSRGGERYVVTARLASRTAAPAGSATPPAAYPPAAPPAGEALPPRVEETVPFPRPKATTSPPTTPPPSAEAPPPGDELTALRREAVELRRLLEALERRLAELEARLVEPAKP